MPAGSVAVYALHLRHRGSANTEQVLKCIDVDIDIDIDIYTLQLIDRRIYGRVSLCMYIIVCILLYISAPWLSMLSTFATVGQQTQSRCVFILYSTDSSYTKGTRAHTHRELIREWLRESKGSSLDYI